MEIMERLLNSLNEEQIKPVLDTEGAVLVIAGAGSGKTRVLTTRIAYLINEKGVLPSEILAITFTNKASAEMKLRLEKIIGDVSDMWCSTIHSMCVRILRGNIEKLGFERNFSIYDETDKDKALKRVMSDLNYDVEKNLKTVKNRISMAKNECLSPEDYKISHEGEYYAEETAIIYDEYEKTLARSNSLDFDDLLFKTYELFKKFPSVADKYSERFRYVFIDEFQDTNRVQFEIAKRLASYHGNLFVVGDDDQSIYGWRGAKIDNILKFDEIYKGAKVYKLQKNYRSTKKILNLANCIIKNNGKRRQKELYTDNGEGARIETFVGTDEINEASYCALQIKNLMARYPDMNYSDFAVFMRLNALSRAFEQEFMKYAIPYRVFGGFRFFERKEIKDVLSYLKFISNPFDDESFMRCVSVPKRGIGEKTLSELKEFCVGQGLCLYDGLCRLNETPISGSAKNKLYNFKLLIDSFASYSRINKVSDLIAYVLDGTRFLEQFAEKTEENTDRLMNIGELKNSAEQFERDNPGSDLSDYLSSVTLSSDTDDINDGNAVTVATIHAVKGLEYKCVFIAGLDENIMPVSRATDIDDDLEEERRLMYVAVTRAKERLYLTRAKSRFMYGRRDYMTESRFLKEARPVLNPDAFAREQSQNTFGSEKYGGVGSERYSAYSFNSRSVGYKEGFGFVGEAGVSQSKGVNGGYSSSYAKSFMGNSSKPKPISSGAVAYKCGMKVNHRKFGIGTVISLKGEGDNVIVNVAFKNVGIKALSAKYAPMEIVK